MPNRVRILTVREVDRAKLERRVRDRGAQARVAERARIVLLSEFLRFLKKVAAAYPDTELHVVCDNYATHMHAEVKAWLARNPRIQLHFTPTGCSWINLVQCFFSVITSQAIRRGSFTSVRQLTETIGAFIDTWNDHAYPFAWTKEADEILGNIQRAKTKTSRLTQH